MPGWTTKTLMQAGLFFCLSINGVRSVPVPLHAQTASASFHNLPICTATGSQSSPFMLPAPHHGAYLFWIDARTARTIVYGQRVDSLGHPLWQDNGRAIAVTSGRQKNFSVASDGNDGVFVVWQEVTADDGDILAQRLSADGERLWGEGGTAIFRGNKEQGFPRVVEDGEGGAYVVWQDESAGSQDLAAQHVNANGEKLWSANSVELVNTRRTQTLTDVLAVPRRGFAIAWQDENSNPARALVQYFDVTGKGVWSDPIWVAQSSGAQSEARLALDSNTSGDFRLFVVWLDRRVAAVNVYAQQLAANGASLWGNQGVAGGSGLAAQSDPRLLKDGTGGLYVIWEDMRNDKGDIFSQRIQQNGSPSWNALGVPVARVEQAQAHPRLASDGAGGFIVVWEDERGNGTNIYAQRMTAEGTPLWDTAGIVLTNHGKKNSQAQVLARFPNRAWTVWVDERNGNDDIFVQLLTSEGTFENVPPEILSQPATQAFIDSFYEYAITAVDYDSDEAPKLELIAGPAWLRLDPIASKLQGTPRAADSGAVRVELHGVDSDGGRARQDFLLQVHYDASQPQILSQPDTLAREDERYAYQLIVRDNDPHDTLRFSLETNATWLALSPQGELAGTPLNQHVGVFAVKIIVTNNRGKTAEQQFTVRVQNTNDAPLFTSTPDTVAFVDSTFVYKPLVQDVDAGDRVTLSLLTAPAWLNWESATQTLRGVPGFRDVGLAHISFRAQDLANAATLQSADVRVYDLGAPDHVAPTSPQNLAITPPAWSADPQFTVRWQNPFDPSSIAGAYYKIGAAPDSNRDGTLVSSPAGAPVSECKIQPTLEGKIAVYVWLVDGRENVDHKTAQRIDYRYDRTPPQTPGALRVHATNSGLWVRGDTTRFSWRPTQDALSGIASYTFNLDDNAVAQISGNDTSFALITTLAHGQHTCQVVAVDSASNRKASLRTTFRVDRVPPLVTHVARDTVRFGEELTLHARASDAASGIGVAKVLYRTVGQTQFHTRVMNFESGEFVAALTSVEIPSAGLEYAIMVYDSVGNVTTTAQTERGVHAVVVGTSHLTAPFATRGEYYQLVSIPYQIKSDPELSWLHDDFGSYEPTEWRLFSYNATTGNVEFGHAGFDTFNPGHALWLITAQPQRYDLGPAYSISTAHDFFLELQPGWNLIASPFDFPTDWTSVQKSPLVETQLWSYDGKQYVGNNEVMQPWQGYFVRNLNSSPEMISIPSRCADCDTTLATSFKVSEIPVTWRMRLHVTNGEFADHDNWLGISEQAEEEWDPLDWSEPPVAPGNFVALRFDHQAWPRFSGAFTADFRPPAPHAQKWHFEILSGAEGQSVQLWLECSGAWRSEQLFILEDENAGQARIVTFDERSNVAPVATFRSSLAPRRFVLWAGNNEQLLQEGVLARAIPTRFALSPGFPNPAYWNNSHAALSTLRFSLPQAGEVDLRIYDMLGRQVRGLLFKQFHGPGHYEIIWDGKDDGGRAVAAGIYLYRLSAANFQATQKLIVLKE